MKSTIRSDFDDSDERKRVSERERGGDGILGAGFLMVDGKVNGDGEEVTRGGRRMEEKG